MRQVGCCTLLFFIVVSRSSSGDCAKVTVDPSDVDPEAVDLRRGFDADDEASLLQKAASSNHQRGSLTDDKKDKKINSFWAHPVTLGLMLGLLLIGPDHLGTLMAVSTLTTGFAAFKVGFAWGLGHSLGMIMICPIFFILRELTTKNHSISVEQWEYYGDYFIGFSMVVVALYFIYFESWYLEKQDDGSYKAKACGCCSAPEAEAEAERVAEEQDGKFCAAYCKQGPFRPIHGSDQGGKTDRHVPAADKEGDDKEVTPLLPKAKASDLAGWLGLSGRDIQGAVLGAMQGLCCPMGMASLGFMGRMSATATPSMLFVFAVVFALASAVGSGCITLCWGHLTTGGMGACVGPRAMYLCSCVGTLLLGITWITCNAVGVLDNINFGDKIHHRIMPAHGFQ